MSPSDGQINEALTREAIDHFRGVTKMIYLRGGAKRDMEDFMLTRLACGNRCPG